MGTGLRTVRGRLDPGHDPGLTLLTSLRQGEHPGSCLMSDSELTFRGARAARRLPSLRRSAQAWALAKLLLRTVCSPAWSWLRPSLYASGNT